MYAIIAICGKQFFVKEGDFLRLEKLETPVGNEVVFDKILVVNDQIGTPYVNGAKVIGILEKTDKEKKIDVLRYRPKSNLRRRYGHRQPFSQVKITKIII